MENWEGGTDGARKLIEVFLLTLFLEIHSHFFSTFFWMFCRRYVVCTVLYSIARIIIIVILS